MTAGPASDPMVPRPYRIRRVHRETHDTFTFELAPAVRGEGCSFAPGQFNMLYVFGMGEVPVSISGDPAGSPSLHHTTRAVGTVTQAMQALKRGDTLGVRGPFGSSWPVEEAAGRDVIIVAGGIGLAPLRPALYHLLAQRKKYRRISLLYGARTPQDILYPRELALWRGRFDAQVEVTVDRTGSEWQGSVGVVTRLIERAPFDAGSAIAMLCGPEVMIRFCASSLERRGLAASGMFVSLERNMKCAVGLCGHCQLGPFFVCRDGPVFNYDRIQPWFGIREA